MVNKEKCTLYHMHALNINVIYISQDFDTELAKFNTHKNIHV